MKQLKKYFVASIALLLGVAANATVIYPDEASFLAAMGTTITDDYENGAYQFVQSDADMTAVLGETSYTTTGFNDNNIIFESGGNQYYCAGCNGSFLLDFTSTSVSGANGVFGVGFDYFNTSDDPTYVMFVTYGDGSTENIFLNQVLFPGTEFFGFSSTLSIATIHFGLMNGGTTQQGSFGMDNLTIAGSATVSVPEPATLFIMSLGLLGLRLNRKK